MHLTIIVVAMCILAFILGYYLGMERGIGLAPMPPNDARVQPQPEPQPEPVFNLSCLWAAICTVESGGDCDAHNKEEDAVGIAQIRPIAVREANRIKGYECWKLADRWNPLFSRGMFEAITTRHTPVPYTYEAAARIWNGGPRGHTKESTLPYWSKVKHELGI